MIFQERFEFKSFLSLFFHSLSLWTARSDQFEMIIALDLITGHYVITTC